MKNGHSRKKSYLPHRGNWQLSPLLSPSDISIEFTYYITKQYLLCSSLDSRNVFGGGGGGGVWSLLHQIRHQANPQQYLHPCPRIQSFLCTKCCAKYLGHFHLP